MNKKYERYINYIVNDIKPPYFINMRDSYGLRSDEYKLVLSNLYDQPVTIEGDDVYDSNGNEIYLENSEGFWIKKEYDEYGYLNYYEDSTGFWYKREYDFKGNNLYSENSNGNWVKREFDSNGNEIYFEDSNGIIRDRRYE